MGCLQLAHRLPRVVYSGEWIFENQCVREYKAKIKKASDLVRGPYDDKATCKKLGKIWSVGLSLSESSSSPDKGIICFYNAFMFCIMHNLLLSIAL